MLQGLSFKCGLAEYWVKVTYLYWEMFQRVAAREKKRKLSILHILPHFGFTV